MSFSLFANDDVSKVSRGPKVGALLTRGTCRAREPEVGRRSRLSYARPASRRSDRARNQRALLASRSFHLLGCSSPIR